MGKKGKSSNPVEAYRKKKRKQEIRKNKMQQQRVQELTSAVKDTQQLKEKINEFDRLDADGKLDGRVKSKLSEMKSLYKQKLEDQVRNEKTQQKNATESSTSTKSHSRSLLNQNRTFPHQQQQYRQNLPKHSQQFHGPQPPMPPPGHAPPPFMPGMGPPQPFMPPPPPGHAPPPPPPPGFPTPPGFHPPPPPPQLQQKPNLNSQDHDDNEQKYELPNEIPLPESPQPELRDEDIPLPDSPHPDDIQQSSTESKDDNKSESEAIPMQGPAMPDTQPPIAPYPPPQTSNTDQSENIQSNKLKEETTPLPGTIPATGEVSTKMNVDQSSNTSTTISTQASPATSFVPLALRRKQAPKRSSSSASIHHETHRTTPVNTSSISRPNIAPEIDEPATKRQRVTSKPQTSAYKQKSKETTKMEKDYEQFMSELGDLGIFENQE